MIRTREEHIKFCKEQAWKQYEYDISGEEHSSPDKAIQNCVASMLSDLSKHPDTEKLISVMAMIGLFTVNDLSSLERLINGFN